MSLYLALGIAAAIGIFLRFRYGSEIIPYAAAAMLLILFLYCPAGPFPGIDGWTGKSALGPEDKVDRLGEVVSFGFLVLAAWLAGGRGRKRSA
ncbi:MAG: hypothetical protein WBW88_04545 [Rhodothermales bacterium]